MMTKHPILLVDDEPEILFSLRGLLRREFELHTAESGAEALDILKTHHVHVLMSDQRMPQMTGVELLDRVRQSCPEVVRIVFTGFADLKAVIDGVNQAQIFRYLTKPWNPDDLFEVLRQACVQHDRLVEKRRLLADMRDHVLRCQELLVGRADESARLALDAGHGLLARATEILEKD